MSTEVGYTGGWLADPVYQNVKNSQSGHAESVKVVYDPKTISLRQLLTKYYFKMHDPTTLNR